MIADKDKVLHSAGGKYCARPDCCVFLNGIYWHCLGLYIGEQKPPVGTGFVPQTSLTGVRKGVRKRVSGTARAEASSFGVRGQEDTAGGEGAGSAGVATLQGPQQLCAACLAAPNKRREHCGDSDGKQREKTPAARRVPAESCARRPGQCGGSLRRTQLALVLRVLPHGPRVGSLGQAAATSAVLRVF